MQRRPGSRRHRHRRYRSSTASISLQDRQRSECRPWCHPMLTILGDRWHLVRTTHATAAAVSSARTRSYTWPRPNRYWNRIRTAPICEACLTPAEREIAGNCQYGVGCRGCYRIMRPLVEPFRRTTCSPACAMRTGRRGNPTKSGHASGSITIMRHVGVSFPPRQHALRPSTNTVHRVPDRFFSLIVCASGTE
jgi:hypothetical protein